MCVGCGGSCSPPKPRFTQVAGDPQMVVIGSNWGPIRGTAHSLTDAGGTLAYETLYTGLGPNGEPALLAHPGTFGQSFRAGRAR